MTSLTPVTGSTGGRTLVTLTGAGFVEGIQVWFGGQPVTDIQVIDSHTLTCRTPQGLPGVADVKIELYEMTSALAGAFTFANFEILRFTYPEAPGRPATVHAWTESGKVYRLQRSLDLGRAAEWQNIGDSVSGIGGLQAFLDPAPPTLYGRAFYRLAETAP